MIRAGKSKSQIIIIYAAEQQGILDDVIKRYDLVSRRRTPGRPLTEEGEYLSFRKGSSGLKGYHAYLKDRLLGAYTMPAAWVGMYGKGGKAQQNELTALGFYHLAFYSISPQHYFQKPRFWVTRSVSICN